MADDAARAAGVLGRAGQVHAAAGQAQGLHAERTDHQQEEADALFPVDAGQDFRLLTIGNFKLAGQAAITGPDAVQKQHHPPPGGKSEQIEQDVGQIGANMPPRLCTAPAGTECDQPGSAAFQVASTRVSQAARAAKRINGPRAAEDSRVCSGEGPLRVLREARGVAFEIRGMRLIIIGRQSKDTCPCPRLPPRPSTLKF